MFRAEEDNVLIDVVSVVRKGVAAELIDVVVLCGDGIADETDCGVGVGVEVYTSI